MERSGAAKGDFVRTPTHARHWSRHASPRIGVMWISLALCFVLLVVSWSFVLGWDRQQRVPFFSIESSSRAWRFIEDLAGVGKVTTPAYTELSEWWRIARLAYETLAMSVLAIMLSGIAAFLTFLLGARNVMVGDLAPNAGLLPRVVFLTVRMSWALVRAVPELVWALIVVFVFAPGILPGAMALAIHNYGVLGKLASEVVEGMDAKPARALQTAGAGRMKMLMYGVLPQALPRFLTYLLYRWEVVIRTTIVVGFVAAGGLGMEFRLSTSNFHYTTVTLLLGWYLILVLSVDVVSSLLRRLVK